MPTWCWAPGYSEPSGAVPTRYFPQASSVSLVQSTVYELSIPRLLGRYLLHHHNWARRRLFESLERRYYSASRTPDTG
jgi:hypothetical protein